MLKDRRQEMGLSQRALAKRSKVAYKTIQLIESGRDCRWSTLSRLAKALDLSNPKELVASSETRTAAKTAASLRTATGSAWMTAFFDFVDDFRRSPRLEKIIQPPGAETEAPALALIAAAVERLCAESGLQPPWWCSAAPALKEPWFVSGMESLKVSALSEAPASFRQRNIFVLGNFLSRA